MVSVASQGFSVLGQLKSQARKVGHSESENEVEAVLKKVRTLAPSVAECICFQECALPWQATGAAATSKTLLQHSVLAMF